MGKFLKLLKNMSLNYDKRQTRKVLHPMEEVLLIVIVGKLVGMEDLLGCCLYAKDNEDVFKQWLPFAYGIPSKNTIYRVMGNIDKRDLQILLGTLICAFNKIENNSVPNKYEDQIAIDGKTIKGSKRKREKGLHILNAFTVKRKVPIASITIKSKDNEITTIPHIIHSLNIEDNVITIDAIGTQVSILNTIIDNKGSFILPVKENQKTLYYDVSSYFKDSFNIKHLKNTKGCYETFYEKCHSCIEKRECFVINDISWITEVSKWSFVKSIGCIRYTTYKKSKPTVFARYFICSDELDVHDFATIVRNHWSVETMHWYLDTVFKQDFSSLSNYSSVENYDLLCKFAYSLVIHIKEHFNLSTNKLLQMFSRNPIKYIPYIFDTFL